MNTTRCCHCDRELSRFRRGTHTMCYACMEAQLRRNATTQERNTGRSSRNGNLMSREQKGRKQLPNWQYLEVTDGS